jgi:hypothetical protein
MNDNKLIAEFMGYLFENEEYYLPLYNSGDWFKEDELMFNESWDWLMPVVNKCLKTGDNTGKWDEIYSTVCTIDIKEVYKTVVKFIEE